MSVKTRTFNGLYYDSVGSMTIKYKANEIANKIRKSGYGARIIKKKGAIPLYTVYQSRRKLK